MFGKGDIEIQSEDRVKLPVIAGIKPRFYLALIYGAAILLVLFLVFIRPGLKHPGSLGVFSSEPSGAAVRVDNITLGTTPCTVFIPRGKHTIEFVLPNFDRDRHELEVPGRILGSVFFPARFSLKGTLKTQTPAAAYAAGALEYIRWSLAKEPVEDYQAPLSLSEAAYRTGPAAADPSTADTMNRITEASLRYASTKAAARDLLRAKLLIDNAGLAPSPLTMVRSAGDFIALVQDTPRAAEWLASLLPREYTAGLTESAWYKTAQAALAGGWTVAETASDRGPLSLAGLTFVPVNQGRFSKPGAAGVEIPPLYAAQTLVTQSAWDAFTVENPFWAAENREALEAAGLAGSEYLSPVEYAAYPVPAAPGISWYAAREYCRWLTGKLPQSLAGWEVRLPTETEWEYILGDGAAEKRGIRGQGLLWEWCAGFWAPLDFFPQDPQTEAAIETAVEALTAPANHSAAVKTEGEIRSLPDIPRAPERSVRGGSWINPPGQIGPETRGSLPPETSSPFVGFRPVIVQNPISR